MLDATRCLSYWTQSAEPDPRGVPRGARRPRLRLRHLPGRLPVEPRRREAARGARPRDSSEPHVSLADWLQADDDELAARYDRLFVPRNDPRYLRRNALVALGNAGGDPALPSHLRRETTRCCASTPSGHWSGSDERRAAAAPRRRALDRLGPARRRAVRDLPGRDRPATTRPATSSGRGSRPASSPSARSPSLRSAGASGRRRR